jgi:hypothetical protein
LKLIEVEWIEVECSEVNKELGWGLEITEKVEEESGEEKSLIQVREFDNRFFEFGVEGMEDDKFGGSMQCGIKI